MSHFENSVTANEQVVALLERWLEVARAGTANYVALAMVQRSPNLLIATSTGDVGFDQHADYAVDLLKTKIKERETNLPIVLRFRVEQNA